MDFDLHFGRFFGPKIDVFEKFLLPDFELQLEIRSAKIVILLRENAIFYKIDIVGLKWESMKNMKKAAENRFKINLFFEMDFSTILDPTGMDFDFHFGGFFGPKIDVFEKFLLPDFELQLEVRSSNRDFT